MSSRSGAKMINPEDLEIVQVIDDPDEIVAAIFRHYETRSFTALSAEQALLLNL